MRHRAVISAVVLDEAFASVADILDAAGIETGDIRNQYDQAFRVCRRAVTARAFSDLMYRAFENARRQPGLLGQSLAALRDATGDPKATGIYADYGMSEPCYLRVSHSLWFV